MLASGAAAQPQCMSIVEPMERLACFERQAAGIGREEISVELIDIPLGDPRALNQNVTRSMQQLEEFKRLAIGAADVGLTQTAFDYAQKAQALDSSIRLMIANQAVNEAIYYNDPRRLAAVLSASSLGPVNVIAQRKDTVVNGQTQSEVVFTITTPGNQPLSPQFTQMTAEELQKVARPYFDAEYRQNMAAINQKAQEAYAEAEARARGEAAGKGHGMPIGEPTE
jgi:hypothetical protein